VLIKAYPIEDHKNNKKLIRDIKNYQKNFPCCKNFPTCPHPRFQTDPRLHLHLPALASSYFDNLKKYLKDTHPSNDRPEYTRVHFKMWAFISKDKFTSKYWHQHALFKDNTLEISSLMYLTETKMGTMFDVKHLKIYLKPQLNTWFFWPSHLWHAAAITKANKKDRITIATAIILKPISLKM